MQASTGGPSFVEVARSRPVALVSPGHEAVDLPLAALPKQDRAPGPPAPYAAVVLSDLTAAGPVHAGFLDDAGRGVLAELEPGRERVRLLLRTSTRTRVLATAKVRPGPARGFGLVLAGGHASVVVDTGQGWRPLTHDHHRLLPLLDLRDPAVLAAHGYAWGADGGAWTSRAAVRAGVLGPLGVRDPHLVQTADGDPWVRDGRAYLTMTCAGPGFFPQAHWGVFALDLADPSRVEQVGHLFFRRDGLVLGDHAGQLVVDGDRLHVAVSSWGDFTPERGVHVRHADLGLDQLTGVHVVESTATALPTLSSAWDPAMTRIDGRWHVAFVESPSQRPFVFHPALATTEAASWTDGLALVGADSARQQTEGPVLARLDGEWRLLASDGDLREYPVYDLAMRRRGSLDAPYGTNIPHPQLLPLPAGSPLGTELMVTFDGTSWGPRSSRVLGYGTHGDLVVLAR